MIEQVYKCDECGKEIRFTEGRTIFVLTLQGFHDTGSPANYLKTHASIIWRRSDYWLKHVCLDCFGPEGEEKPRQWSDRVMPFLRRIGLVRRAKE